jgi:hypothetical protein
LADIQAKRKEEEEQNEIIAKQIQEKRKKFKEALLEKAFRNRKKEGTETETDNEKDQMKKISVVKNKCKKIENEIPDEEKLQLENERIEKIGAIRRKFKEQNRKILQSLMEKKRLEDEKELEKQQLDELQREKRRQKAIKLAARREISNANKVEDENEVSELLMTHFHSY